MLTWLLSLVNLTIMIMALLFAYESHREGEVRAQKSGLARILFPHVDNLIYDRKWKPRKPREWMAYS